MKKLGTLLTLSALAICAAPAGAAPPGLGFSDESTCGTIVHSAGNSAYIGDQHYAVISFAFAGGGGQSDYKKFGNKTGISGDQLACDITVPDGTLTVTLAPLPA